MNVYTFLVPNPFGVCTSARVATYAENRQAAVHKIREAGLRVDRREFKPFIDLTNDDLTAIDADRAAIWIMDTSPDDSDGWMPVERFREAHT